MGYPTTREQMEQRLQAASAGSGDGIFVAELDSVIGWIQVSVVLSLEAGLHAEIRGLVVAESMRRVGLGSQLVAAAEKWAGERGCDRIRVRTNVVRKKTREFYRKLGYHVTKRQEVFDKALTIGGQFQV